MKNSITLFIMGVAVSFYLALIGISSAQTITALGEIRTRGAVFIASSSGQWVPASSTYPLLQATAIKVDDGSAALYFRDGSRVDLSKDTVAAIDGSSGDYTVNLSRGGLTFSVDQAVALSVTTPHASVLLKASVARKVSGEKRERAAGYVFSGEKGTEVRNISGNMVVTYHETAPKVLAAGEGIFVSANNVSPVYSAGAVSGSVSGAGASAGGSAAGMIGAVFVTGGTAVAREAWRGSGRVASPSGF